MPTSALRKIRPRWADFPYIPGIPAKIIPIEVFISVGPMWASAPTVTTVTMVYRCLCCGRLCAILAPKGGVNVKFNNVIDTLRLYCRELSARYAEEYEELLAIAKQQDTQLEERLTQKTLETTQRYRDFKATGTNGIISCNIRSVILPLLADHVLREANHYLRLLEG